MQQLVRTLLVVAVSLLGSMPVQGADASTSPCKSHGGIRSAAPLQLTKPGQSPGQVVADAALRAVLSIEEHEMREQLVLDSRRSQPLDPHSLPTPTNTSPKAKS